MAKEVSKLEGFVTYRDAKFFCEGISEYAGCEIDPDGSRWGLEPHKLYKVYRPKSEVVKPSFVLSCNAKPLLINHPREGAIGNKQGLKSPKGATCGVLTEVRAVGNELHGRIEVWDPSAIELIHRGKRELSLGYTCIFKKEEGEWNGEHYDFLQSGLNACNHLALVDEARNGHDCRVVDRRYVCDTKFKLENPDMDMKNLTADEVVEALKQCSDECREAAKKFLNTPTEDELKKAEEEEKAKKAQDEAEKAKLEEEKEKEKKEAVDKAVEEQKEADAKECEEKCEQAANDAVSAFRKAVELAEECRPRFGRIALDGIRTEQDLAVKVCTCDAAPSFLKSVKPSDAVIALRSHLASIGIAPQRRMATDSAVKPNAMSVADYMKSR